jgi:ribonuclease P protein component
MGHHVSPLVDSSVSTHWLGYVVPKRHARRAVTRSLLKRQIRSVFQRHAVALPTGLWLVRLRQPFATADYVSARSRALTTAARAELEGLLTFCHVAERP